MVGGDSLAALRVCRRLKEEEGGEEKGEPNQDYVLFGDISGPLAPSTLLSPLTTLNTNAFLTIAGSTRSTSKSRRVTNTLLNYALYLKERGYRLPCDAGGSQKDPVGDEKCKYLDCYKELRDDVKCMEKRHERTRPKQWNLCLRAAAEFGTHVELELGSGKQREDNVDNDEDEEELDNDEYKTLLSVVKNCKADTTLKIYLDANIEPYTVCATGNECCVACSLTRTLLHGGVNPNPRRCASNSNTSSASAKNSFRKAYTPLHAACNAGHAPLVE
jgi:hypothetical protein